MEYDNAAPLTLHGNAWELQVKANGLWLGFVRSDEELAAAVGTESAEEYKKSRAIAFKALYGTDRPS